MAVSQTAALDLSATDNSVTDSRVMCSKRAVVIFPNVSLSDIVDRCIQIAYERNISAAIRDLKQQLNSR
ncbi:MAG: hypothetical protein ACFBSC_06675 [Microcoleaceae cyanobacterium]